MFTPDGYLLSEYIERTPPIGSAGAAVKFRLLKNPDIGLLDDEVREGLATCLKQLADFAESGAAVMSRTR